MHDCSKLVDNCKSISQLKNRGAYSIIYNDGSEKVFSSFRQLLAFIIDNYMTTYRVPYLQRAEHENRIIQTLTNNGITARGVKTRKYNKKRKGTNRKGRK